MPVKYLSPGNIQVKILQLVTLAVPKNKFNEQVLAM